MKFIIAAPFLGSGLVFSAVVAQDIMKLANIATYISSAAMLITPALAQDDNVPPGYIFPPGTPVDEDNLSMTVAFDADVDEGAAKTSSSFPDDHKEDDEPFGVLFLDSPNAAALSDLSEGSDWVLTGCDPQGLHRQTVVAFCSKNLNSSSCAHVFRGQAEHTIVQMPKGCGKGPLARVHALSVHPDPGALLTADLKRKPASEAVYQLVFDYDFTAIPEENGPVYMRADVTDMPGYWDSLVDSPTEATEMRRRRAMLSRRTRAAVQRRGWWSSFVNWVKKVTTVSASKDSKRNFQYSDTVTIFNSSKQCGAFTANLQASVTAQAQFNTAYGLYFQGTIVPPNIQKAFVYFNGDAAAGASFTVTGVATVEYDSNRARFATFGFPGLSVPGIITVGPSLYVEGYISGSVTINGTLTASADFKLPPIQVAVGPGSNTQSNAVDPVSPPKSGITTSLTAGVAISANAALHVVPGVQLGVTLLGGSLLDANVYVEADLFVGIGLNSSISTTSPFTVCVNPYFGLELQAGLRGSLGPWKGQAGPYDFYENQFDIASKCYQPGSGRREDTLPAPPAFSPLYIPRALPGRRELHEYDGSAYTAQALDTRAKLPGFLSCPKKA